MHGDVDSTIEYRIMRVSRRLAELIEPVVTGLGYECFGIEYVPHSKHGILRVFIDSENGILLDDCSKVSHQLSGVLDVENPIPGHYQLEVSSPGLDRSLFRLEHFERFKNKTVSIRLIEKFNERKKFRGGLIGVKGDNVVVEEAGESIEIPFRLIEKARLVPDEKQLQMKG